MTDDRQQDRETRVRERAYQLWEGEGRPAGRHDDHWHDAAREIDGDETVSSEDQVQKPAEAAPPAETKRARAPRAGKAAEAGAPLPKAKRAVKPKTTG
ncbi:DUF2934 domain-containing protein [Sphingomonas sp. IW22]|uniref:DUF2934 domain-containing protein n=1 Tax=Sphingomonas sp. IW22 TaxID=3242489 RepID=UPI003521DB9C